MSLTIWHNPRCSKSRETLARIEASGVTPTVRRYLDDPPTASELSAMLALLGLRPGAIVRTKEAEWGALGIDRDDDDAVIAALAAAPKLIERPIVSDGTRAIIGRPPSNVDALLA